ncbi:MAG: hypothetical protein AAGA86_06220 [Bacteroidota bacterium]
MLVMHELSHAYYGQVLGNNYAPIIEAYGNAILNRLYVQVSYHAGNGSYFDLAAHTWSTSRKLPKLIWAKRLFPF